MAACTHGVLLVANAQGELLMCGDAGAGGGALHLPEGDAEGADDTAAAAAWRALRQAAGAPVADAAAAAARPTLSGLRVCLSKARGAYLELFCSQHLDARDLGARAVQASSESCAGLRRGWRWVHPSELDGVGDALPWRLRRCLHAYGTAFKACVRDQGRPEEDSSADGRGEWAALAARFPAGDGLEVDSARARELASETPALPRDHCKSHESLLRRSCLLRMRARRAGRITAAQAARTAAAVAQEALRAALRGQRIVGSTWRDHAAAEAKRVRRAAEHAESCEEEADVRRTVSWANLDTLLRRQKALMTAVRARVRRGHSRIGVTEGFQSGLPHKAPHLQVWEDEVRAEGAPLEHLQAGIRWPFREGAEEQVEFEEHRNLPSVMATTVPEGSCETLSPRAWTTQAVEEYCHFGTVREVPRDQCKLICALSMALKGSGRYRLCLDLRPLNKYLRELKFTMETLSRVRHLIRRDDWLMTIDLESAYNNFHVHEEHQAYACFEWGGRYFVYVALSFGSSAAPFAFQKIMDAISKHLRGKGLRMGCYLDDLWFAFADREEARRWAPRLLSLFKRLGLIVNEGKSVLEPAQLLRILGMDVDTTTHTFAVPEKRVAAMEEGGAELLALADSARPVRARDLAKMVGRIMSCHVALGSVVRRRTRRCYAALAVCTAVPADAPRRVLRAAWDEKLLLPAEALRELRWWMANVRGACLRGGPIAGWHGGLTLRLRRFDLAGVACSDTGDWGVGCFAQRPCAAPGTRELGREALAQEERTLSSTRRELLGAERALRLFVGPLPAQQAGGELIFLIDNQGAAEGLEMGSPTPALQTIIERCRDHCDRWGVELAPAWARRSTPEVAICDFQGKRRDDQAWQLAPSLFRIIDHEAGFGGRMGHEVDMFADADNHQLPVFWSRWRCRGSAGRCAFRQDWGGLNLFANPPFVLIAKVVAEARRRSAALTLVCQFDPQRLWWPLVRPEAPAVVATLRFAADPANYLVEGRPLLRTPKADIWVVRLDFTLQRREAELRAQLATRFGR